MSLLRRALVLGIAFGLVAATAELWLNLVPFFERRFGPGPVFFSRVVLLQAGLGAALGLLAAPALLLPRGVWVHLGLLAASWYGLESLVALDSPLFAALQVVPALAGLSLVPLGLFLARARPALPWAIGALLLCGAMIIPQVYLDLTTPEVARPAQPPAARPGARDVVLIVLDTVRAANVSTYGYDRATAPTLDALAREGALFEDATSPSTWSLPSHASLFTGRWPSSHGAHAEHHFLDDRFPTLASVLESNGYETFCITANAWISDGLGLTRGFAWQDESLRSQGGAGLGFSFVHRLLDRLGLLEADKGGELVARSFEAWARERPKQTERPAFVFLNFIEAHFPYHQLPHDVLFEYTDRPYAELREISVGLLAAQFGGTGPPADQVAVPTRAMYDAGILYTDRLLERVVSALRARGTLDETLLVVLADHGEILGERGGFFGHGPTLYQEAVGVPLLIRYPDVVPAGVRVAAPVSTLSVFATIMDLAGVAPPPTLQAGSLLPLIAGKAADAPIGPILAELHDVSQMTNPRQLRSDPQMQRDRRYRLLRRGDLKLVAVSGGEYLLYDLANDPQEQHDVAGERPEELAMMRRHLLAAQTSLGLPGLDDSLAVGDDAPDLDEATRQRLRALGYLE